MSLLFTEGAGKHGTGPRALARPNLLHQAGPSGAEEHPSPGTSSLLWQELLRNLNLGGHKAAVSSLAVVLSLEGKASHRELTSRLLSDLVGKVLSPEDIAAAFDRMLHDLPDLILDTPEAPQVSPAQEREAGSLLLLGPLASDPAVPVSPVQMLGQFIARAVADHALPLDFLERYKGRVDCEHAR